MKTYIYFCRPLLYSSNPKKTLPNISKTAQICLSDKTIRNPWLFLTASKYCGSGLKIGLVVVVILIVVLVIELLSNWTAFVRFNVIKIFRKM